MVINKAVQMALVAAALLMARAEAAVTVKLCGRQLSEMMSKVCHVYNSPHWETPSVVEQHGAATRRKRDMGISDECCTFGCSLVQLTQYCSISAYSESPLDELEDHMIADRSAESGGAALPGAPGQAGAEGGGAAGRQVGRGRSRGYGRARGRRCWCRRKRRSGRRRADLMGAHKKCSARCARAGHRVAAADVGPHPQH